jgi:hypothetical protein
MANNLVLPLTGRDPKLQSKAGRKQSKKIIFPMISVDQARAIDPELKDLSDEEVLEVINDMYGLGQLAFEKWQKERFQKS